MKMEKLTYQRLMELPSGSEILEHYHIDWDGGRTGEMKFKLAFRKGVPYLRGEYGGCFKLKPESFERNEYFLVKMGTWRRKDVRSHEVT